MSGDSIPLLGRLLGVADYLDALTSARAYHAPKSLDEVVQLIVRGAGVMFDPQIAEAVVRLHDRRELHPASQDAPDADAIPSGPER